MAAFAGPFFYFDEAIQTPFTDGVSGTVNAAVAAVQGPITAIVVLWIIVTGVLVMRGDVSARTGIMRLTTVSLVVGIAMSTALYNEYITNFFTTGIPNWIATTFTGARGTAASPHEFDTIWENAQAVFAAVAQRMSWMDVIYNLQLAFLAGAIAIPIGVMFVIFEVAHIMLDVVVSAGPFLLLGYLFTATKGIADRFIGKLISLSILVLLINIVLAVIVNGYTTYIANTLGVVTSDTERATDVLICNQMFLFFCIGSLIAAFLPGIAAFLGGGVSVSPLAMIAAATQAGRAVGAVRGGRG